MKQTKILYVQVGQEAVPVIVTLEAPAFLTEKHGLSAQLLLRAAADEQDMLVRSRHHKDRDVRILARACSQQARHLLDESTAGSALQNSQELVHERPRLRLVA